MNAMETLSVRGGAFVAKQRFADAIAPLTEAKEIEDGLMYMEPPY